MKGLLSTIAFWLNTLFGRSDIYFEGDLYMRRWRIGPKSWPGLRLHHIVRSDRDRELHDHPFWFVSIMLRGSYTEHLHDGTVTTYSAPRILFRSAMTLHRLELESPVWTLVFRGAYRREWGFMTRLGWIPWQLFTSAKGNVAVEPVSSAPFRAPSSMPLETPAVLQPPPITDDDMPF